MKQLPLFKGSQGNRKYASAPSERRSLGLCQMCDTPSGARFYCAKHRNELNTQARLKRAALKLKESLFKGKKTNG